MSLGAGYFILFFRAGIGQEGTKIYLPGANYILVEKPGHILAFPQRLSTGSHAGLSPLDRNGMHKPVWIPSIIEKPTLTFTPICTNLSIL